MTTQTEAAFTIACTDLKAAQAAYDKARNHTPKKRAAGVALRAAQEAHEIAATACRAEQEALRIAYRRTEREKALAPRRALKAAQTSLDI